MKAVDIKKSPLCYYALEWFNALMMTMMMNKKNNHHGANKAAFNALMFSTSFILSH